MFILDDPTVAFLWESVIYRDFDVDLYEPGERSGEALQALMDDQVIEILSRCDGVADAALAELAWCHPGPKPYSPVARIDAWLRPRPELRSRWLTRMSARLNEETASGRG